jgi:hypothetical protein
MKTKKIQNILKFVDKNLKFKSEFRGKRRASASSSTRSSVSKTIKYKNKRSSNRRIKNKKIEKTEKTESVIPPVEKHPDGFIKLKCSPKLQ